MMDDLISRQAVIEMLDRLNCCGWVESAWEDVLHAIERVPAAQPEKRTEKRTGTHACDLIDRQAAIDALYKMLHDCFWTDDKELGAVITALNDLPSAHSEIIRCKDCKYGEQDEAGRWFCRSLGCQIGNEDGGGFCADAERRTDEA